MLIAIVAYLLVLILLSVWSGRRQSDNETFFRARRRSPWMMVAFGMIGASISGVSFVSVPGMVLTQQMTYLQLCLGFVLGYAVVAFVLLPVYYRLNLTSIYTYLEHRLGPRSYRTGSLFFMLSKLLATAIKFYLFCLLFQRYAIEQYFPSVPFSLTVVTLVLLVWLYSRRGGISTLVVTDVFQTFCMLTALLLIIWQVVSALGMSIPEAARAVAASGHSRVFEFSDWHSPQYFWKQFLSGIFIVIVMTGLDQDMMQKNLTCRSLREAQKDMCTYGLAFVPVNVLFLSLGLLLMLLAGEQGLLLPTNGDELLPVFAVGGRLGEPVVALFTIGLLAASLSTADSALTSLTTICCIDQFRRPTDERLRRRTHFVMALLLALTILLIHHYNSRSLLDAVYTIVSYTYGPLLGLFAFGLLVRRPVVDRYVPWVCVASPLLCLLLSYVAQHFLAYRFGYELLMLNGLFTFVALYLIRGHRKRFSNVFI